MNVSLLCVFCIKLLIDERENTELECLFRSFWQVFFFSLKDAIFPLLSCPIIVDS